MAAGAPPVWVRSHSVSIIFMSLIHICFPFFVQETIASVYTGACPPDLTVGKTIEFHRSPKSAEFLLEHIFLTAPAGSVIYCRHRNLLRRFIISKLDTHEDVLKGISGASVGRFFGWEASDRRNLTAFKNGQLEMLGIIGPIWDHRAFLQRLGDFPVQVYHIDLSYLPLAYMAYASAVVAAKKCVFYFSNEACPTFLNTMQNDLQV